MLVVGSGKVVTHLFSGLGLFEVPERYLQSLQYMMCTRIRQVIEVLRIRRL